MTTAVDCLVHVGLWKSVDQDDVGVGVDRGHLIAIVLHSRMAANVASASRGNRVQITWSETERNISRRRMQPEVVALKALSKK